MYYVIALCKLVPVSSLVTHKVHEDQKVRKTSLKNFEFFCKNTKNSYVNFMFERRYAGLL